MTCHLSILKPCLDSISSKSCKHLPSVPTLPPSIIHTLVTHYHSHKFSTLCVVIATHCHHKFYRRNALFHPVPTASVAMNTPPKRSLNTSPVKKFLLHNLHQSAHPRVLAQTRTQWALHNVMHCWFGSGPRVQSPVDPQVRSWLQDWKQTLMTNHIYSPCYL